MRYVYDLSGSNYPMIKTFDIATATALAKGAHVKLTSGLVVASTLATDVNLGVVEHASAANATPAEVLVRVFCSPTAVFAVAEDFNGIDMTSNKVGDTVDGTTIVDWDKTREELHVMFQNHHFAPRPVVPAG